MGEILFTFICTHLHLLLYKPYNAQYFSAAQMGEGLAVRSVIVLTGLRAESPASSTDQTTSSSSWQSWSPVRPFIKKYPTGNLYENKISSSMGNYIDLQVIYW